MWSDPESHNSKYRRSWRVTYTYTFIEGSWFWTIIKSKNFIQYLSTGEFISLHILMPLHTSRWNEGVQGLAEQLGVKGLIKGFIKGLSAFFPLQNTGFKIIGTITTCWHGESKALSVPVMTKTLAGHFKLLYSLCIETSPFNSEHAFSKSRHCCCRILILCWWS